MKTSETQMSRQEGRINEREWLNNLTTVKSLAAWDPNANLARKLAERRAEKAGR